MTTGLNIAALWINFCFYGLYSHPWIITSSYKDSLEVFEQKKGPANLVLLLEREGGAMCWSSRGLVSRRPCVLEVSPQSPR